MKATAPTTHSEPGVLVAEPEHQAVQQIATLLRQRGLVAYRALTGQEALDIADRGAIRLAVIDVELAPEGGLNVLRALRRRQSTLPCLVVAPSVSRELLTYALRLQAFSVVHRQARPSVLAEVFERALLKAGRRFRVYDTGEVTGTPSAG